MSRGEMVIVLFVFFKSPQLLWKKTNLRLVLGAIELGTLRCTVFKVLHCGCSKWLGIMLFDLNWHGSLQGQETAYLACVWGRSQSLDCN